MISVITPTAYDYTYFLESLQCYYGIVDEVFVGLDRDRISWAGNKFTFNEDDFYEQVQKIDVDKKVTIIEDNFHPLDKPMKNETYEKNYLSSLCKPGNWILQIESDEFMLNPNEFKKWLEENKDFQGRVRGQWITVYKAFGDDLLLPNDKGGQVAIGTKLQGQYTVARETNEPDIQSPMLLLHYSWGRTKAELLEKFKNWGHAGDFDPDTYADMWDKVTLENYQEFSNLHPLDPSGWPNLLKVNRKDYENKDKKHAE